MTLRNCRPPSLSIFFVYLFVLTGSLGFAPKSPESVDLLYLHGTTSCGHVATEAFFFASLLKALRNDVAEESFDESLSGKKEEMRSISKNTCQAMHSVSSWLPLLTKFRT